MPAVPPRFSAQWALHSKPPWMRAARLAYLNRVIFANHSYAEIQNALAYGCLQPPTPALCLPQSASTDTYSSRIAIILSQKDALVNRFILLI